MAASKYTNQVHISSALSEKIRTIYFKYLVLALVLGLTLVYFILGLTFEFIVFILLSSAAFVFFKFLYNDFVDLSLVGEYMIIKKSNKTSMIAPITKIHKCKTTRFLNLIFTSVEFNLDGIKRKVYFVSSDEKMSVFNSQRTEQSLKVA